jgi:hypothetical protein
VKDLKAVLTGQTGAAALIAAEKADAASEISGKDVVDLLAESVAARENQRQPVVFRVHRDAEAQDTQVFGEPSAQPDGPFRPFHLNPHEHCPALVGWHRWTECCRTRSLHITASVTMRMWHVVSSAFWRPDPRRGTKPCEPSDADETPGRDRAAARCSNNATESAIGRGSSG